MSSRKEAAYQIINAAKKAGMSLSESKFNCFTGVSGGNIQTLWPELTNEECQELAEVFPSLSQDIRETFPSPEATDIVFNVTTKSFARSTVLQVDLESGQQHAIIIKHGADSNFVARELRGLADMISGS